jgi:polyhydroxyalkanoate synthesis regulator phasin
MSEPNRKERIVADLQRAKQTGELKTEKIREIVKNAIAQMTAELQEGRGEIAASIRDAISAVVETFQEKSGEIKEEVTASIEGAIEGVGEARRLAISKTQGEIDKLQSDVEIEEERLQQDIDGALTEIETQPDDRSAQVREVIVSAVETVKNSEEAALLQKRYAQLKAQLAVVRANLSSRYGTQYEDANKYLEEAKNWYEKAKEDPEVFTEPVKQKRAEFEQKLGEAGGAIARKERQVKQLLQELWRSLKDIFQDK